MREFRSLSVPVFFVSDMVFEVQWACLGVRNYVMYILTTGISSTEELQGSRYDGAADKLCEVKKT
jgi:hypothetical protein